MAIYSKLQCIWLMELLTKRKITAYSAPEVTVLCVVVEKGYSFSDPIKDKEQGWD